MNKEYEVPVWFKITAKNADVVWVVDTDDVQVAYTNYWGNDE